MAKHRVVATPIGREIVEPKLEPTTVGTRDEVEDVAMARTGVQDRALSLAVKQAALRSVRSSTTSESLSANLSTFDFPVTSRLTSATSWPSCSRGDSCSRRPIAMSR